MAGYFMLFNGMPVLLNYVFFFFFFVADVFFLVLTVGCLVWVFMFSCIMCAKIECKVKNLITRCKRILKEMQENFKRDSRILKETRENLITMLREIQENLIKMENAGK
jgi:hypothetical protein